LHFREIMFVDVPSNHQQVIQVSEVVPSAVMAAIGGREERRPVAESCFWRLSWWR
jgi:hypothetical protein